MLYLIMLTLAAVNFALLCASVAACERLIERSDKSWGVMNDVVVTLTGKTVEEKMTEIW